MKNKSKLLNWLSLPFIISLSIFIFSMVYQNALPKIVEEINNGAIGAILTAFITVLLLSQQTESETIKEKGSKVFEKKLEIYDGFVKELFPIFENPNIDDNKTTSIIFSLARIKMHTEGETIERIDELINHIIQSKVDTKQVEESEYFNTLSSSMMEIVELLQVELYGKKLGKTELSTRQNKREKLGLKENNKANPILVNATKLGWSGYWFVNIGESQHRSWKDCINYGFISAGNGKRYADAMKKINIGDRIFAYFSGYGYVGYGIVTSEAIQAKDFITKSGKALTPESLIQPGMLEHKDNAELSEYPIAVRWEKIFEKDKAKKEKGMFVYVGTLAKLNKIETLDFLKREFEVKE